MDFKRNTEVLAQVAKDLEDGMGVGDDGPRAVDALAQAREEYGDGSTG